MYVGRGVCVLALVAVLVLGSAGSAWSQGDAYEGGRVVSTDERSEDIRFGSTFDDASGDEEEAAGLPWIPILSPTMICLDCWMTKTYKIWDFYHQQAAQEYFAHSESCADLVLCPDPCVGTALKYTLLAPIYAIRPHLLLRNCSACGISNPYGVPDPMPSVAVNTADGPRVLSTAPPAADFPAMMPESAPMAPPADAPSTSAPIPSQTLSSPAQSASASKWSQMTDQEILAHFGLKSGSGPTGVLDGPTSPTSEWEFADTAPSTPASELIASMEPPAPIAPLAGEVKSDPASGTSTDSGQASAKKDAPGKSFSVTDVEYDRMRDIEKGLLAESGK